MLSFFECFWLHGYLTSAYLTLNRGFPLSECFFQNFIRSNCSTITIPSTRTSNHIKLHQRYFNSRIHCWSLQTDLSNVRFTTKILQSQVCLYWDSKHKADNITDNHTQVKIKSNSLKIQSFIFKFKRLILSNMCHISLHSQSFLKNLLDEILDPSPRSSSLKQASMIQDTQTSWAFIVRYI